MRPNISPKILWLFVFALICLIVYKSLGAKRAIISGDRISVSESSEDSSGLEEKFKEYIMNNPEVIISSVENFQKKKLSEVENKVKAYIKDQKTSVENEGSPPFIGDKDASINLVFFYDYNCSYCKEAWKNLKELLKENPDVKIILRPIPILGQASEYSSKLIIYVARNYSEKLGAVHEALLSAKNRLSLDEIRDIAKKNDIDYLKIEEPKEKEGLEAAVNQNVDLSKNLKIQGTPAYLVDGTLILGLADLAKLKEAIGSSAKKE